MMRWFFALACLLALPAHAAERIVALSPHACEMLFVMGAGPEVVGVGDYCDYPEAAKSLPKLGSYSHVNAEAALKLKPTLVIVMDERSRGIEELRRLGIKVFASHPLTLEALLADMQAIGDMTGHSKAAATVVENFRGRLRALEKRHPKRAVKVFYEVWGNPLISSGRPSLMHDVMFHVGLDNICGELDIESPHMNVEAVMQAHPDVIIIPDELRNIAERTRYWRKWLGDEVRIVTVNPDLLHRPGPRLIEGMEALFVDIHGSTAK